MPDLFSKSSSAPTVQYCYGSACYLLDQRLNDYPAKVRIPRFYRGTVGELVLIDGTCYESVEHSALIGNIRQPSQVCINRGGRMLTIFNLSTWADSPLAPKVYLLKKPS